MFDIIVVIEAAKLEVIGNIDAMIQLCIQMIGRVLIYYVNVFSVYLNWELSERMSFFVLCS